MAQHDTALAGPNTCSGEPVSRIGIDARLTYYHQGGIARYITHLIQALADLDTDNEYIILHSRKDRRTLASAANQRRVSCWTPSHHRLERLALAAEVAPLKLDMLHSPDFIPPVGGRWKSVITIHDLSFLHFPETKDAVSRRYYNGQIHAAVARADAILADSDATRQDVIAMLNVPPDRVTTVYAGIDARFKPVQPDEIGRLRAAYDLPGEYVLFVGTIEPRKNLEGLMQAYAALRADLPDAPTLVIVGRRGWLNDPIHALPVSLGITDRIHWIEDIPDGDLPALYNGASVLCLPSLYEGFGFPVLEAMACGTLVVTSDRGSLPEVAGDAAILVDPDVPGQIAGGLRRALTDRALGDELRRRGFAQAAKFPWAETARRALDIYRRVLED
jgi:glycosyltransferase involved in cell wall biosynthesis